jgi:hypothetical protein
MLSFDKFMGRWAGPIILSIMMTLAATFLWFANQLETRRNQMVYTVVYYPVSSAPKTYENVTHMSTNGKGTATFVYNGKQVELIGDMEITKK